MIKYLLHAMAGSQQLVHQVTVWWGLACNDNWRASETLTGVTQSKIGDVNLFICIHVYVWTYVCHFVL